MFCRKCGKEIPEDSSFCPKCGEKVTIPEFEENAVPAAERQTVDLGKRTTAAVVEPAAAYPGQLLCKECGKPIPDGNMFCPVCGTDVPSTGLSETVQPPKKSRLKPILISVGAAAAVLLIVFFAVVMPEMHREFYYDIDSDNGNYIILGMKEKSKDVKIPDTIWFKPVYAVADEAFMNTDIESVSFGKNIRYIGMNAFRNCLDLETVKFSQEMEYARDTGSVNIIAAAFGNCRSLTSVKLPNINTNIYGEAFLGCVKLRNINLDNVSMINFRAFVSCTSLTEIDTDAVLGNAAFEDCTALQSVSLYNTAIPERCFSGCTSLEKVWCWDNSGNIQDGAFENCVNLSVFCIYGDEYNNSNDMESSGAAVSDKAFTGCSSFMSNPTTQQNWAAGTTLVGLTQGEIKRYFNNDYKRTTKMGYVIEFCNGDIFISEQDNDSSVVRSVFLFGEQFLSSDLGKTDFIHVGMTVREVFEILGEMPLIERNEMEYSVSMEFEMYGYQFILSLSGKSPESIITNAIVQIS